jgi:hypothetical protein
MSAALRVNDTLSLGLGAGVSVGRSQTLCVELFPTPTVYSTDETDSDAGVIAGGLWRLTDEWALGLSYRGGADLRFDSGRTATLPDVLAAGARWRSSGGRATVAVEAERLSGLEDRTRLQLGGEWVFLSSTPLIGVRAGVWHDPRGGVVTVDTEPRPSSGDGATHVSCGIGAAFRRFQVDVAVDASEETVIGSASAIFTF